MAMFGNSRPQIRPFVSELEASMGADGAYEAQLRQQQALAQQGGPAMGAQGFGGQMSPQSLGGFFNAQGRQPSALTAQMPRMSNDAAFTPNPQLQAPMQAQPQQPDDAGMAQDRPGGMFGRKRSGFSKFLHGAGKVLETVGAVAAFGPFAPIVMRDMKQNRQWRERERGADLDLKQAHADYYRAQASAKDDGLIVVGGKLVDRNTRQVVIDGNGTQQERLLAELDDPSTPEARRKNIERVLNITPSPQAPRPPQYMKDDAGRVFEVGPDGVKPIGGGLFVRPPAPPQPRETSPNDVAGPILAKLARGETLTPYEQQALEYAKPRDPMDEFVRRMLPGGGPSGVLPTRRPPPAPPKLDANGNVPNPFGLNAPPAAPPSMLRGPTGMPGRRNGGQTSGGRGTPAPMNPAQRRFGQIYTNPRGQRARWTAAGWEPVQ